TTKADAAFPGIVRRSSERVGGISAVGGRAGAEHAFGNDRFRPARWTTLFEFDHLRLASEKLFLLFFRAAVPKDELEKGPGGSFGELEDDCVLSVQFQPCTFRGTDQRHFGDVAAVHQGGSIAREL